MNLHLPAPGNRAMCGAKITNSLAELASGAEVADVKCARCLAIYGAAPEMAEMLRSLAPAFAIASAPFVTTDDGTEPFEVRCLASRGSWAHQKLIEARDKVEAMLARIDGET